MKRKMIIKKDQEWNKKCIHKNQKCSIVTWLLTRLLKNEEVNMVQVKVQK